MARANGAAAQTAAIQLHALTYNWTRVMQLANTPPLQSTTPGLHPVSIHQTSPLVRGSKHPITSYYSRYRPRKDERLSRPAWLVTYRNKVPPPGVAPGYVTHPSTNRARRRVTSLIRPTPLPVTPHRHTHTQENDIYQIFKFDGFCTHTSSLIRAKFGLKEYSHAKFHRDR